MRHSYPWSVFSSQFTLILGLFLFVGPVHAAERVVPNDPLYYRQWALRQIDTETAWSVTTGSRDVIVAIIDGGFDIRHPDLWSNVWVNEKEIADDGIDNDGNGYVDDIFGWNFVNNTSWVGPMDAFQQQDDAWSHGTIVASLVAARGNNAEGIAGVTWNSRFMPLVVLDGDGFGNIPSIVSAIRYAVKQGASVINLSLTGFENDQTLDDVIREAEAANVLVVVAAGNDSDQAGRDLAELPVYPACSANASSTLIAVTGTDVIDQRAPYADFGAACTDIAAPGHELIGAHPTKNARSSHATTTPFYIDTITGTSAAAPLVSGTAALIRSVKPDWTVRQVRDRILDTADPIEAGVAFGQVGTLGRGRLNAGRALSGLAGQSEVRKSQVASRGMQSLPEVPRWAKGVWHFLEQL
ncbi:S8 family serine peptidase [Candidatus Uhrbacteria bacterium]|nr:S8 family serine peptidase [Candidatus Uhrbacteria bacterium]